MNTDANPAQRNVVHRISHIFKQSLQKLENLSLSIDRKQRRACGHDMLDNLYCALAAPLSSIGAVLGARSVLGARRSAAGVLRHVKITDISGSVSLQIYLGLCHPDESQKR